MPGSTSSRQLPPSGRRTDQAPVSGSVHSGASGDPAIVITARGAQVTDVRPRLAGQREDERVQTRVRIVRQKRAAADRHNMALHERAG